MPINTNGYGILVVPVRRFPLLTAHFFQRNVSGGYARVLDKIPNILKEYIWRYSIE